MKPGLEDTLFAIAVTNVTLLGVAFMVRTMPIPVQVMVGMAMGWLIATVIWSPLS